MLRSVTSRNILSFVWHKNITNGVPWRMALCFNSTPVIIYCLLPASNARSKGIHKKSRACARALVFVSANILCLTRWMTYYFIKSNGLTFCGRRLKSIQHRPKFCYFSSGLCNLLVAPHVPYAVPVQELPQNAPQIQTAHRLLRYGNSSGGDCTYTDNTSHPPFYHTYSLW